MTANPPQTARRRPILVVGAGVIGLSSAIRLREAGHAVTVYARERTPATTSDAAAAIYFPFGVGPWTRVVPWARRTLARFRELHSRPEAGIRDLELLEVYDRPTDAPWWRELVTGHRRVGKDELPADYVDGFAATVPLIEMPRYMPFLERWLLDAGGTIEHRTVKALDDLEGEADVIVNCTGVGAHSVVPDPAVFPLRGQTVWLSNPGLRRGIVDELTPRALAHTIPRSGDVVAGGTLTKGDWSLEPDPVVEAEILAKARRLEPGLAQAKVLGRSVGLRPGRPEIRLDVERRGALTVVHNYGHAGAGVSLSWGCASDVAGLVGRVHPRMRISP